MTEDQFKHEIEIAHKEILYWRKRFLGFSSCVQEDTIHAYFQSIPCEDINLKGSDACYKECVHAYFQFHKDKETK